MKNPTPVNKELLQEAINQAEKKGPKKNLSTLWKVAADIYNNLDGIEKSISFSVVGLRAQEWKLTYKTISGKTKDPNAPIKVKPEPMPRKPRGPMSDEHKAAMAAARSAPRRSRGEKFQLIEGGPEYFAALREDLRKASGPRYLPLVTSIEKGSRSSAVKLFCITCCGGVGGSTGEVRRCTATGQNGSSPCPLWMFRPYQGALEPEEQPEGIAVGVDDDTNEE
jgi:hypothetical protein